MKNIRQAVFETNSSSSHSVTISTESAILETFPLNDKGNLEVTFGEYGWDEERFYDKEDRLSYAATYVYNDGTNEEKKLFEETLKEHTGAKKIKYMVGGEGAWHATGYIDHQSVYEAQTIFSSKESLRMFLFNPNSYFETDNDNH